VADRQAVYIGALSARAMQYLQSYGQPDPVYDNNAYTITLSFDGQFLKIYIIYPTQSPNSGGQSEYYIN
jgi:hypothetical protein